MRIKWELLNASGTYDWDSDIGAIYQLKVSGKPISALHPKEPVIIQVQTMKDCEQVH